MCVLPGHALQEGVVADIKGKAVSPMCASEELFVHVPGVSTMGGKHFYISFAFSSF
jgi:hypothetical protein